MATPNGLYTTRSATDPGAPPVDGVAVSSTNTYYSDVWTGEDADGYSLSVFYTGTPTGAFTLWATDKIAPSLVNDNDWIQDTLFTPTNPAGAAGKFADAAGNFKSYRKRLKYVNASGSGNIFAYVTVPRYK